jgi:predicted nucleic acid-binding protein
MGAIDGFRSVFLDASFLVALFGKQDGLHGRACELFEDVADANADPCTIWDCFSEALTVLRRHHGYGAALALAGSLSDLTIVATDTSHRLAALDVFKRHARKRAISFVDALSAVVVRRELAGAPALSFDRDFRALGLTVID